MPSNVPATQKSSHGPPRHRRFLRRIKSLLLRPEPIYRLYLKIRYGAGRVTLPLDVISRSLPNGVLQSDAEWRQATDCARKLRLPLHRAPEKNWDHLAAVYALAGAMPPSARILDAGAEFYSNLLPALCALGYRHLYGMNLAFTEAARRGPIRYLPGDITRTGFANEFFDAVTCMSVIEHGVPLEAYFREMFRVLRPGGLLITSTDYFPDPIDTQGKTAYGAPITIFSRAGLEEILCRARTCGFETTGPIAAECQQPSVRWEAYALEFSFLLFTLRKPDAGASRSSI